MLTERHPVAILMATYNGAEFLAEQLQSIQEQSHTNWSLWISDDGSTDETLRIVDEFAQRVAQDVHVVSGPGRGHAVNFLHLLTHPDLPEAYLAFADQDDVWLPHKLEHSLSALPSGRPALFGGRYIHATRQLEPIRTSVMPLRPLGFRNALVQNVISGHTTTMTPEAAAILRRIGPLDVPHHDWWCYQMLAGAGADIIHGDEPLLLYRQHGTNAMGAHGSWGSRMARVRMVMGRDYAGWVRANLAALHVVRHELTEENAALVEQILTGRQSFGALRKAGVYRQTSLGTLSLYAAAALGRV